MKKNLLKIRCILVMLLLVGLAIPAMAENVDIDEVRIVDSGTLINVFAPEEGAFVPMLFAEAQTDGAEYVSLEAAQCQLRDEMTQRKNTVTMYIAAEKQPRVSDDLLEPACSEELAMSPWQGDYLRWSWKNLAWKTAETEQGYVMTLQLRYYTTLEEENQLQDRVAELLEEMELDGLPSSEQYTGIYKYIVSHVTYDTEALERTENGTGSDEDELIYTAYGALIRGRAVCQGYAALFYGICRSLDLPARIITGNYHAWNIAQVGSLWYNIDTTWGSLYPDRAPYLLQGSSNFDGHYPAGEYLTDAFQKAYPIGKDSYVYHLPEADMEPIAFTDVVPGSYYEEAVDYMSSRGIVRGISETEFGVDLTLNRGMLVTMLHRMEGAPEPKQSAGFADVPEGKYYAAAIDWAAERGLVMGYGNGCFGPEDVLTREQLATILNRYAAGKNYGVGHYTTLEDFSDAEGVSGYATDPMAWAVGIGVIKGIEDHQLSPKGSAARAQAVTMLYRFINYYT